MSSAGLRIAISPPCLSSACRQQRRPIPLDNIAKCQELHAIAAFLPFVVLGHPSRQVLSHALAMTTFSAGEDAAPLCCSTHCCN